MLSSRLLSQFRSMSVIPEHEHCSKPGCMKMKESGGHRYCTRRHFYADSSRVAAAAVLAARATITDAMFVGNLKLFVEGEMMITLLVASIMLLIIIVVGTCYCLKVCCTAHKP